MSQDYPWPPRSGSLLRLTNVLAALATVGDLELFSLVYHRRVDPVDPAPAGIVSRLGTVAAADPTLSAWSRLAWLASRHPLELPPLRRLRDPREKFGDWARSSYDLVWFSKPVTYHLLGAPRLGPTIVDLDDLEDDKLAVRLKGPLAEVRTSSALETAHLYGARVQSFLNAKRWRREQLDILRAADAVTVCTAADAARLGPKARVIANGYDPQPRPAGREKVGSPPRLMFQGLLHYGPNSDAARWLVEEIGPRLRRLVPDVQIRLVGDTNDEVRRLHRPPGVVVTGKVDQMLPELLVADAVVVPVRYGGGTRIKVLEAFAHRIPVAATSMGAAGLEVVDGRHLLIGDDADELASACATLLTDQAVRSSLAEEAQRLFLAEYRWDQVQSRVAQLAKEVAGAREGGRVEEDDVAGGTGGAKRNSPRRTRPSLR